MIVVADTSPLNYLLQIECTDVLRQLYNSVLVPVGVVEELRSPSAPPVVKAWVASLPEWIEVHPLLSRPDNQLSYLGRGESEAIQIAEEHPGSLLLIDERKGRTEALRRGLFTTGTLGILLAAGEAGLLDPADAYRRLIAETSFRSSPALEARFLGGLRQ